MTQIPIRNFLLCCQCFWCPMTHRKNLRHPIRWWWCSWCSRWEIPQLELIIFCHFWWWAINRTMIRCFWKGLKIFRCNLHYKFFEAKSVFVSKSVSSKKYDFLEIIHFSSRKGFLVKINFRLVKKFFESKEIFSENKFSDSKEIFRVERNFSWK